MASFWEWLSGKKTAFGAIILAIVANGLIPEDVTIFGIINLVDALMWLGNVLIGGGLAHKAVKATK